MKRTLIACTGLVSLAASQAIAGSQPATIDEFFTPGAGTRIIAHRGFSAEAPENTLAAIRSAIEIGADMAEIDVTLTADGEVVVIHDETVQRTTDGTGLVSSFMLADLQTLDAGSWFSADFAGERIPSLDEVLAEIEGRILLNVEIKSEAVERGITAKVAAAIHEHGVDDQVMVSSFSPTALEQIRSVAPEVRTAVLYNSEAHRGRDPVEIVRGVGATSFNIKRSRLTRKMLQRCRANGIPVGVYTVNTQRRMRKMVKRGVDAIFTDHPDRLLEVLKVPQRTETSDSAPLDPVPATP